MDPVVVESRDTFHYQFLLSPAELESPDAFVSRRLQSWTLATHPALPVHPLVNSHGSPIGFVLGIPILRREMKHQSETITWPDGGDAESQAEEFLRETSGRYLVLLLEGTDLPPRIYPDAFASLSAVYSPEKRIVASTTSLLNHRHGTLPEYALDQFPDTGLHYYPAGLTDFDHCRRLLPNHVLDLKSWKTSRFWPREAIFPCADEEVDRYVSQAVEAVRQNIIASAVQPSLYGGLTAGRDSRVLLACTPPEIRDKMEFVTFAYPEQSESSLTDLHIAGMLAKRHCLRHRVIDVQPVSPDIRRSYFYRIGRAGGTGKSRDFYEAARTKLSLNSVWMTGFGGEVSCMYYVRDSDQKVRPSATELLDRVHIPERPGFVSAVQNWLEAFPKSYPHELIVELFYIENRVGTWACPHLYGAAPFYANFIPFCDRRYIEACFRMPYAFRRSRRSQVRMIEWADRDLLETPFEALTGWALLKRRLLRNRYFNISNWFRD